MSLQTYQDHREIDGKHIDHRSIKGTKAGNTASSPEKNPVQRASKEKSTKMIKGWMTLK